MYKRLGDVHEQKKQQLGQPMNNMQTQDSGSCGLNIANDQLNEENYEPEAKRRKLEIEEDINDYERNN